MFVKYTKCGWILIFSWSIRPWTDIKGNIYWGILWTLLVYFFFEVKASYQLKMFHTGTAFFNMLKGLKIQQQFSLYRGLHTIILLENVDSL